MKIAINKLKFSLPESIVSNAVNQLNKFTVELKKMTKNAGTNNSQYQRAYSEVIDAITSGLPLHDLIDSRIKIHVLANILNEDHLQIKINSELLNKVNTLSPTPNIFLTESLYQYYLTKYDEIQDQTTIADWLLKALKFNGLFKAFHANLLAQNGPEWLAKEAINLNTDLSNITERVKLDSYLDGDFIQNSKRIYFIEQLRAIPANEPHKILTEVQRESTFNSRYDGGSRIGHKVLEILIQRAPSKDISDDWLNVILRIAGDPRVSQRNPKYMKWWSQISPLHIKKVKGWLSKLDLRLFLEALYDLSNQSENEELRRMFPSRKYFLEGLLNKDLITSTQLFLSRQAEQYLKKNYSRDQIPHYYSISDDDRSIIHVEIGETHIIEGSHSCYMWIYEQLHESAIILNPTKRNFSYRSLTLGLNEAMEQHNCPSSVRITHNPTNFSWQHSALLTFQRIGIPLTSSDVIQENDQMEYLRRHGAH